MGNPLRSDDVYHGRNASPEQDDYVRCSRCGFYCRLSRDNRAPEGSRAGWGITNTSFECVGKTYNEPTVNYDEGSSIGYEGSETYDQEIINSEDLHYDGGTNTLNYDGIEKSIYDPVVTSGCPSCGTLLYNK